MKFKINYIVKMQNRKCFIVVSDPAVQYFSLNKLLLIERCISGYYTCVEVIFTLRRQVGFYMMGVYAPTLLIVVLSWLSFWINPDASAARVPLGTFFNHQSCHQHLISCLWNSEPP